MLMHRGTVRIETARLILRPFDCADARDMFQNWASDPEVTRYLSWPPHKDLGNGGAPSAWCALYDDPRIYNWAVELRKTGEVVGNVSPLLTAATAMRAVSSATASRSGSGVWGLCRRPCVRSSHFYSTRWAFTASRPGTGSITLLPAGLCRNAAWHTRAAARLLSHAGGKLHRSVRVRHNAGHV